MELYATHNIYKTSFGDFVPYIMSNALGLNFLIVPAQPIPDAFEQGVHLVTPLSDLPHHDTPVIVVKWGEHYDGCTPVVKMAWSYVLSLNTNDAKLLNSKFKISEKLPIGALSDREETIHISSLADKVDTNMAHSFCSWTPADDVCVETNESSKGIDVTDCTVNQLHIDESQSDEPRDFLYELQEHRKNNPKILITGSLNINSIRNKFDSIQHMLQCRYIDILALCETKLDDSFPIGQFDVLDYNCARRDRSSNGGGLMYYFRSDIPHRRRDDLEQERQGRWCIFDTGWCHWINYLVKEDTMKVAWPGSNEIILVSGMKIVAKSQSDLWRLIMNSSAKFKADSISGVYAKIYHRIGTSNTNSAKDVH